MHDLSLHTVHSACPVQDVVEPAADESVYRPFGTVRPARRPSDLLAQVDRSEAGSAPESEVGPLRSGPMVHVTGQDERAVVIGIGQLERESRQKAGPLAERRHDRQVRCRSHQARPTRAIELRREHAEIGVLQRLPGHFRQQHTFSSTSLLQHGRTDGIPRVAIGAVRPHRNSQTGVTLGGDEFEAHAVQARLNSVPGRTEQLLQQNDVGAGQGRQSARRLDRPPEVGVHRRDDEARGRHNHINLAADRNHSRQLQSCCTPPSSERDSVAGAGRIKGADRMDLRIGVRPAGLRLPARCLAGLPAGALGHATNVGHGREIAEKAIAPSRRARSPKSAASAPSPQRLCSCRAHDILPQPDRSISPVRALHDPLWELGLRLPRLALGLAVTSLAGSLALSGPALAAPRPQDVDSCTIVSNPTASNHTDCPGASLVGANLAGVDLSYANFRGAALESANLAAANLSHAVLAAADLSHSNLSTATLDDAYLAGTQLHGANVDFATSGGLTGAPSNLPSPSRHIVGGYLIGPRLNLDSANLAGVNLTGTNLTRSTFTGADLEDANLSGTNLHYGNYNNADLENANLTGSNLRQTTFDTANLNGVTLDTYSAFSSFTNASLVNADLAGFKSGFTTFAGANLTSADLTGASFRNTSFIGALLDATTISGASFTVARFRGIRSAAVDGTPAALPDHYSVVHGYIVGPAADLSNAGLYGADLRGVSLAGANLGDADLDQADLTGGSLHAANLDHTFFHDTTCPDGTNSDADGYSCRNNRTS